MKTNLLRSQFLAGAALALATGLSLPTAIAGPGPDYWQNLGRAEPGATPAAPGAPALRPCTDAHVVPVTETKSILANGRGPTRTVEVGRKLVCTSCDTPTSVMRPSGPNARGAMAPVAIKGTHDCAMNGCTPSSSVASIR